MPDNCRQGFAKYLERIKFAMNTGIGVWEADPATNAVIRDDRSRGLSGLAKENIISYEQAPQYIQPDDLSHNSHEQIHTKSFN